MFVIALNFAAVQKKKTRGVLRIRTVNFFTKGILSQMRAKDRVSVFRDTP
jgi:hypothetical protein